MSCSSNGQRIAAPCDDGHIRVYDLTGAYLGSLHSKVPAVRCLPIGESKRGPVADKLCAAGSQTDGDGRGVRVRRQAHSQGGVRRRCAGVGTTRSDRARVTNKQYM